MCKDNGFGKWIFEMAAVTIFPRFLFGQLSKIGAYWFCNVFNSTVGAPFPRDLVLETHQNPKSQLRYFSKKQNKQSYKMPAADSSSLVLKYTKVVPDACPPTKGSLKAAGYDLKSSEDITVPSRGKALVDTGLKIELPEGCYGRIAPRSGLAVKNFIDVGAGVVDEDYRGVLKVVLFNHSDSDFEVKKGDRIAQLICQKIYYPDLEEVQELTDTQRGEGGFGSTGTN